MRQFGLIFKYTLWRTLKHPMALFAMLLLPLGIIFFFAAVNAFNTEVDLIFYDRNIGHTWQVLGNLFFFQLFGAMTVIDNMYEVMRGGNKWRFFAAPVKRSYFPVAVILGGWVATFVQGLIIILVTGIVLNVNWGAWWVIILLLLGMSLFGQGVGLILFGITKNASSANGIAYPLIFILGSFTGIPIPLVQLVNHPIVEFIGKWSPLTLAVDAVWYSSPIGRFVDVAQRLYTGMDMGLAMRNVGLIFVMTTILWVVGLVIGKVKKEW